MPAATIQGAERFAIVPHGPFWLPVAVSETIGARAATAAEARILKETRVAPLLTMERTAYDEHGRAVEHGLHLYRASLCTLEVTQEGRLPGHRGGHKQGTISRSIPPATSQVEAT